MSDRVALGWKTPSPSHSLVTGPCRTGSEPWLRDGGTRWQHARQWLQGVYLSSYTQRHCSGLCGRNWRAVPLWGACPHPGQCQRQGHHSSILRCHRRALASLQSCLLERSMAAPSSLPPSLAQTKVDPGVGLALSSFSNMVEKRRGEPPACLNIFLYLAVLCSSLTVDQTNMY